MSKAEKCILSVAIVSHGNAVNFNAFEFKRSSSFGNFGQRSLYFEVFSKCPKGSYHIKVSGF